MLSAVCLWTCVCVDASVVVQAHAEAAKTVGISTSELRHLVEVSLRSFISVKLINIH